MKIPQDWSIMAKSWTLVDKPSNRILNFELYFRHLVLLETNSFENVFKTVEQRFAIWCK